MSDYHLQQLAAASASIPGGVPGGPQPAAPEPVGQMNLPNMSQQPSLVIPVATALAQPAVPGMELAPPPAPAAQAPTQAPAQAPAAAAMPPMAPAPVAPQLQQQQQIAPVIPAPHPTHAPPQQAPMHVAMAPGAPPQQQQAPQLLIPPPQQQMGQMHHNAMGGGATHMAQMTHPTTHQGGLVAPAMMGDAIMDPDRKFHDKCAECITLRQEVEIKNVEIRKLKQELYKKNKSAPNIPKGGASLLDLQGENITIDVDIGPSSSRTRSYDQRWKARFQDLVKYKLQHGDCVVPKSYKDKGLHSWVRKQRILKKDFDLGLASDESMTQERVNALNSIGFAWVVGHQSNDTQWESNFQQLVVFKSQFGHTRVPQSYDKTLHKWVLNQRCRRRLLEEKGEGKAKGMTWARVEKLDAIDFAWSGKK